MINLVDVIRRMPEINTHFRKLRERPKEEFKHLFWMLVPAELMRPEIYPGFFDDVNMAILGDFWISHAEIMYTGKEKDRSIFTSA